MYICIISHRVLHLPTIWKKFNYNPQNYSSGMPVTNWVPLQLKRKITEFWFFLYSTITLRSVSQHNLGNFHPFTVLHYKTIIVQGRRGGGSAMKHHG